MSAGVAYAVADLDGDGVQELVAAKRGTGANTPTGWYVADLADSVTPTVRPFAGTDVVDPLSGKPIWGPGSNAEFFVGHFTSRSHETVCALNAGGEPKQTLVCFDAINGGWSVVSSQSWGPIGISTVVDLNGDGVDELLTTPPTSEQPAKGNAGFTLYRWESAQNGFVFLASNGPNGNRPSAAIGAAVGIDLDNLGAGCVEAWCPDDARIAALQSGNYNTPDDSEEVLVEWESPTTGRSCLGVYGNHLSESRRHLWIWGNRCSDAHKSHSFALGDANGDGRLDLFMYKPADGSGDFYIMVEYPNNGTVPGISAAGLIDIRPSNRRLLFGRFQRGLPTDIHPREGALGFFDSGFFAIYDPIRAGEWAMRGDGVESLGDVFHH